MNVVQANSIQLDAMGSNLPAFDIVKANSIKLDSNVIPAGSIGLDKPQDGGIWDKTKRIASKVLDAGSNALSEIGIANQTMAKSESEGGRAAGETALALGSGMIGAVEAPLAQGIARLQGQSAKSAKQVGKETGEFISYQPKSELAQSFLTEAQPYISLPSILGNILERDPATSANFGKGLPLGADKVTSALASALQKFGQPLRDDIAEVGFAGGTIEDLTKTALEFYGYGKIGKVKDLGVKGLGKIGDIVKNKISLKGTEGIVPKTPDVPYSITPEVSRIIPADSIKLDEVAPNLTPEQPIAPTEIVQPAAPSGGKPILSQSSLNGSEIRLSFDDTGKVPTVAELKEIFPNSEVAQFQKGVVSATRGTANFRIDVTDGEKMSSEAAKKIYNDALGGLPEKFNRETTLERSIPLEERFGTVVKTAQERMSGIKSSSPLPEVTSIERPAFYDTLSITTEPDVMNLVLSDMKTNLEAGQGRAGGLQGQTKDGVDIYAGSGYPSWFSDIVKKYRNVKTSPSGKLESVSAKDFANIIDKGLKGDKLTTRQRGIWEDANRIADSESGKSYAPLVEEFNRITKGEEYVTAERQLAEEGIDASTVGTSKESIITSLGKERDITPAQEAAAYKELDNFFSKVSQKPKGDVQTSMDAMSYEKNFLLDNPTTEISKPLPQQATPKQTTLYSGLDITKIIPTVKALWEKPVIQELVDAYKRPPEITEVKTIIGKYTGALQMIDHELSKVGKDINSKIPKDRQEAITRYMQAGGDEKLLGERANQSKTVYKKHHEAATKLTSEEKQSATDIRKRLDDVWQKANEAGILDDYVENYVRGEWVKPNDAGKKLISHVSSGTFQTNPHEAMHKVFQNYFDGEQLGYKPTDSTIGYQLIAAERSLRNAIEARKALKSMMGSKEIDGRPTVSVGGAGNPLPKDSVTGRESYFVNPNIKGKDTGDYKFLDHPAMRKWKWVDKDEAGNPIFIQGNMWIHPDAYGKINALLGRSKIREYAVPVGVPVVGGTHPGAAMLQAGAFVKGTILLGPFHQFHVAEHAVFHKVNPFNTREIDFEARPILKEGVEHGLQIVSHNALQDFGEGLATGGLFHKIPIVGDYLKQYQEWLFQGFIPKLKAEMFEHAVNRAETYYAKDLASGKFTRDQLLDNAAKQGNAAFGEINYKYIGRDPTLQDAFRIIGLAPDFLEARLKFAGQALRPKGKEQAMALIRGAVIMGTTAQVLNVMIGDDHKPHWDRPFSLVVGGREYTPRSVVGDIMHLATDPRNFAYQRLNPLWGKPVIEMASGKDRFGRTLDAEDMVKDILKSWIPIPGQGLVKDSKDTFLKSITNTLFQSIGLSNYEYRTSFEKALMETHSKKMVYTSSKEDRDKYKLVNKYSNEIKNAIKSGDQVSQSVKDSFREDLKSQKLYVEDIKKIVEGVTEDKIAHQLESGFLGVEDIMPIWSKASDEERAKYLPIIAKKLVSLANNHPQKFQKMAPEIKRTFAVNQ